MVAQTFFSNAFVADGVVPDEPGLRTVVEYRSRLYSVPLHGSPASRPADDEMDVITANNDASRKATGKVIGESQGQEAGFLALPDPAESEDALRHLTRIVDVQGIGSFDPRYFMILKLVPPMYLNNSARALVVEERPRDDSMFGALTTALRSYMYGSKSKRDTELSLVSWHWAEELVAFGTGPHLDRICAYNLATGTCETSGERVSALLGTRCIAFRPFAGRALAVGCNAGVALLRGQRLDFLEQRGHTHIVSLDWSPDGSQLATASAADGTVRIWDIGTRKSIAVGRGSIVRFSPKGGPQYLFVANPASSSFRLWCCRTWRSERWGSLSGPVVAVTWSRDGTTLLFSTHGESSIHVINVGLEYGEETRVVHSEVTALPREGPGGTPILLEMDGSGERLAVAYEIPKEEVGEGSESGESFAEDMHRRHAVALYATQLRPSFRMSPIGYISGPPGSGPAVGLKFKPNSPGSGGSVLSCMWRNGEVSFVQLVFNASRL